jgi:hypothetical protein
MPFFCNLKAVRSTSDDIGFTFKRPIAGWSGNSVPAMDVLR